MCRLLPLLKEAGYRGWGCCKCKKKKKKKPVCTLQHPVLTSCVCVYDFQPFTVCSTFLPVSFVCKQVKCYYIVVNQAAGKGTKYLLKPFKSHLCRGLFVHMLWHLCLGRVMRLHLR